MICPHCNTSFEPKPWPSTHAKYCSNRCNKQAWASRNRARIRTKNRKYVRDYRARRLATTRRYGNGQRGRARKKAWYEANRVRLMAAKLARYHSDPAYRKANASRSVAHKKLKRHNGPRECFVCASKKRLHCHHVDFDPLNNIITNLVWLCHNCHMEIHRSDVSLGARALGMAYLESLRTAHNIRHSQP